MWPVLLVTILSGCKARARPPIDPHSFAEPDRVSVRALDLDLTVDFTAKTLSGTTRLQLTRTDRGAPLVLDDEGLVISSVTDCAGGRLAFHVGSHGVIGAPLRIDLGSGDCVEIAYSTPPDAGALLWVEPTGTAGGKLPMLFTESQSILARTWIPLQDTPSVRFTYTATIHAPEGMWALRSGENPRQYVPGGIWHVTQSRPIPSYLMALAVGDFTFREIGPRSGVYAEPAVADAAAQEFGEVEAMMAAAERLYGPYRWGRYDMLVLPPSFPFGGMENPNLTFLTPTVISGDRALVSLIAHELAHSWSGNLVTNKTWNDSWLNEGITTYVERRIMEELRGPGYATLLWYVGSKDIAETIAESGSGSETTKLAHAYGRDVAPDDIPNGVQYDKGALFMRTLEVAYGRDAFDRFLRGWFDHHLFLPVDSRMFAAEARRVLGEQHAKSELGLKVDVDQWLYQPGLPPAAPTPSVAATRVETAATELARTGKLPDAAAWTTLEWTIFLRGLPKDISPDRLQALDDAYHLTGTANSEIAMYWLPLLVAADVQSGGPAIQTFLTTIGRLRMVRPLYAAMMEKNDTWRALAKTTFERAKPLYHPITRGAVAELLAGTPKER